MRQISNNNKLHRILAKRNPTKNDNDGKLYVEEVAGTLLAQIEFCGREDISFIRNPETRCEESHLLVRPGRTFEHAVRNGGVTGFSQQRECLE